MLNDLCISFYFHLNQGFDAGLVNSCKKKGHPEGVPF